jgi:hypothetical protein
MKSGLFGRHEGIFVTGTAILFFYITKKVNLLASMLVAGQDKKKENMMTTTYPVFG